MTCMTHSFVAVKLLPGMPAWSTYGQSAAQLLVTTPFLALYIQTKQDALIIGRPPNLFLISHERPGGLPSTYFTLNHSNKNKTEDDGIPNHSNNAEGNGTFNHDKGEGEKNGNDMLNYPDKAKDSGTLNHSNKAEGDVGTLTVIPPLPFRHPLYLSIVPRMAGGFPNSIAFEQLVKAEEYQFDEPSLKRLLNAIKAAGPSVPGLRETSTGEEPPSLWDTWSGNSPIDTPGFLRIHRYIPLSFDLVSFNLLPVNLDAKVLEQITLYRQLYLDYSWKGCESTIQYIESIREDIHRLAEYGRAVRLPSLLLHQETNPSVDAARPSAMRLLSIPIPHDGEPGVDRRDNIADSWKSDASDENEFMIKMAEVVFPVKADKIKMVVLDCDSVINLDRPLAQALGTIFPPDIHQYPCGELLFLYVHKAALLHAQGPDSAPAIIQEISHYLGTTVSESAVQDALARLATPKFHDDVLPSISSLIDSGYVVIVLSDPRMTDNIVSQLSSFPMLFCDATERTEAETSISWNKLFEFCKKSKPDISRNEILIVTPNLYAIGEQAALAGFPTMFLRRARSRSLGMTIPTFSPTYTVASMDQILPILLDPHSAALAKDLMVPPDFLPLRIRGCYQTIGILGRGSFGYIWNGIQLHTAIEVAIKIEEIHAKKRSILEYEAAVYAQLKGVKGVVKIHWSGVDQNAHVLVMDRLSPNLENMRCFCRGALSLKTVLMLGEQMLTTIESVHARGIIVRDIKPENFAMGLIEEYKCLYMFDMNLSKLYLDPTTGKHIPFRDGRTGVGTPRYASHNYHSGLELSRRDDVEAIGITLLYMLHGRLPWQGIYAPDIPSKMKGIGEMKCGKPFADLLSRSPPFFTQFFQHCRSLEFEEKPDYAYLKNLLRQGMKNQGWEYDWNYDWWSPTKEQGTLLPGEYRIDKRFVQPVRYRLSCF